MRAEVIREVEQFLYREARLLDERRLHEWVELFTEDVRYWMSMRSNRYPAESKAIGLLDQAQESATERRQEEELAILDETKATLHPGIAGLDTVMAWPQRPPWRTPETIRNIEADAGATPTTRG